jgi:hypothetical protein
VTTKVAIGRGPSGNKNYPEKLDHFIFLKKGTEEGTVEWVDDEEKIEHYGKHPTEITIILLDDDIDTVFRTEYAWWSATGKECSGDGEQARRDNKPYGPCANSGQCKEYEDGKCKPSADLYFMLADYPSLGTVCRLHTSSYQSVREVYSALNDLKNMMGGRLMGLPVKLFVRPEKNVYTDNRGAEKVGTKYVLGIELRADSLPAMLESVSQSAQVFADLKKVMGSRNLQIVEDDDDRAPEIAGEFHQIEPAPSQPPKAQLPAPPPANPKLDQFNATATEKGLNKAKKHMLLGKHDGNLDAALDELAKMPMPPKRAGKKAEASAGIPSSTSAAPAPAAPEASPPKYTF